MADIEEQGLAPIIFSSEIQEKDGFYITANIRPITVDGNLGALSDQLGVIFIARHPCEILRVSEVHDNNGTGSIRVKANSLDAVTLSLSSSSGTVVTKEKTDLQTRQLKENQTIELIASGSLTNTQSINITIYLKYLGRGDYK